MDMRAFFKSVEKLTVDNSPTIMTALGISGTIATAYLASKASIKASAILNDNHYADTRDAVKLVWKLYIPTAITGTLTIASIFGANHVSSRRATAVATAYSISERAFSEYKEKVVEKMGEQKERKVRDEIAQDRVNRNPPEDAGVIITDGGDVLCHDQFTGRYFKSSMEKLRRAENDINHLLIHQGYASLTDLYHEVGLPQTNFSDEIGWTSNELLSLEFSTVLSPDNQPCISIDFNVTPNRGFSSFAEG